MIRTSHDIFISTNTPDRNKNVRIYIIHFANVHNCNLYKKKLNFIRRKIDTLQHLHNIELNILKFDLICYFLNRFKFYLFLFFFFVLSKCHLPKKGPFRSRIFIILFFCLLLLANRVLKINFRTC